MVEKTLASVKEKMVSYIPEKDFYNFRTNISLSVQKYLHNHFIKEANKIRATVIMYKDHVQGS